MLTNAAVPPLHAWLSDAYPRASVFGTVFLAAFTTKAAVYALIRGFPGLDCWSGLGTIMALFGVVYAVLENDIRRLLAYHIISQVGYMVAGVGLGTALALNGASAHAFAHIFYKGLLMMSAGAVIYATGRGKLTELGSSRGRCAGRWCS
jgi:multicomponent Na+:H+ antiporter subunit D